MAITMDGIFVNGQKATFRPEDILNGDASAYTQEIGTAVEAWMEENVTGGEQVTDTTLTLPGVPADAEATGDEINSLKEELTILQPSATAEDVGKALIVKAVSAGAPTEFEYGETGHTVELDDTLTDETKAAQAKAVGDAVSKTVTPFERADYAGNLVDNTNATISGEWVKNCRMAHPVDGKYYSNPLEGVMSFVNAYPCDENGNTIPITKTNGSVVSSGIRAGERGKVVTLEFIDITTINYTIYSSLANYNNNSPDTRNSFTGTLASVPTYWKIEGKGYPTVSIGMTAEPSETYVSYVEPVIYYGYRYADDLDEHIAEMANTAIGGFATATLDDIGKTPKIKSVSDGRVTEWEFFGTDSYFEPSYNLIDMTQFKSSPVGGYWVLNDDYYFPVTEGKKICTSAYKLNFIFYDATYTRISSAGVVSSYIFIDIPTGATWAKMTINASSTVTLNPKMVVYEVDSTIASNDDRREWVPQTKIVGNLVEGDIYNTAKPLNLSHDILTASVYKAVRALNHQRNAFRIGTFNIYVSRQRNHWDVLKQELKDHSLDMCVMQEVNNNVSNGRYVQNFLTLNTWQFKYGSQSVFDGTASDKATVSVYEIVSTELFTLSTNRTYTRTIINLPRYKEIRHQFTLSLYSIHLHLTKSSRLTEIAELLAVVAQDTSDFIVIAGDTNTFDSEADAQGKREAWEAFVTAGFTPIHNGESGTTCGGGESLDQIFMGPNVSCLFYDVISSNDYPVVINNSEVPISDHDLVYADLAFNFDAFLPIEDN